MDYQSACIHFESKYNFVFALTHSVSLLNHGEQAQVGLKVLWLHTEMLGGGVVTCSTGDSLTLPQIVFLQNLNT